MTSPTPKDLLLHETAKAAYTAQLRTGFPAEITLSQWAIESAWGSKPGPSFNYFGIKYASRHYSYYWGPTTEYYSTMKDLDYALSSLSIKDYSIVSPTGKPPIEVKCYAKFAAYSSLASALDDYVYLMTMPDGPYSKAFQAYLSSSRTTKDLNILALSIAKVYATSPSYGELLTTIMAQSNIQSAIEVARASATASAPEAALPNGPEPYIEPTITLTSLLDSLGSSYLFYREPYFYLCDKLPDGSLSTPRPISALELGLGVASGSPESASSGQSIPPGPLS